MAGAHDGCTPPAGRGERRRMEHALPVRFHRAQQGDRPAPAPEAELQLAPPLAAHPWPASSIHAQGRKLSFYQPVPHLKLSCSLPHSVMSGAVDMPSESAMWLASRTNTQARRWGPRSNATVLRRREGEHGQQFCEEVGGEGGTATHRAGVAGRQGDACGNSAAPAGQRPRCDGEGRCKLHAWGARCSTAAAPALSAAQRLTAAAPALATAQRSAAAQQP